MNWYFASAGALMIVIGAIHSLLGERLIFRRMRAVGVMIPTNGGQLLREPHVRILWASWDLATVMGVGLAFVLFWLAQPSTKNLNQSWPAMAIAGSIIASASVVLIGTKGRHPGWAGLLAAAVLTVIGMVA